QGVAMGIRRDVGRYRNLHFRTSSSPAPYTELRADTSGPLVHTQKPPVRIPLPAKHLRLDAAAIVTHNHAQLATLIFNFYFDACRFGMAQRVDQRFPND